MTTKEQVLTLLEKNRGKHVSGAFIARQLQLSRNSVWKAIKELEKDGYCIAASTNKGYCLSDENDLLSVQGITPYLTDGRQMDIHIFDSLESTNRTAKEMAVAGALHGTVIIADCQTAGRGRHNRSFYSPAGKGLYMSMILHPSQFRLDTPTLITALCAVAVCRAVEAVCERSPQIKWVNDLFLDGKKICGILTEAVTDFESGTIEWIVVGIGINLTTQEDDFPVELRETAGALFAGAPLGATRNRLAAQIIEQVLALESVSRTELLADYKQRLFMLGELVTVLDAKGPYRALAVDIDDAGRLIVKTENGKTVVLSAGEIRIQPRNNCHRGK